MQEGFSYPPPGYGSGTIGGGPWDDSLPAPAAPTKPVPVLAAARGGELSYCDMCASWVAFSLRIAVVAALCFGAWLLWYHSTLALQECSLEIDREAVRATELLQTHCLKYGNSRECVLAQHTVTQDRAHAVFTCVAADTMRDLGWLGIDPWAVAYLLHEISSLSLWVVLIGGVALLCGLLWLRNSSRGLTEQMLWRHLATTGLPQHHKLQ